MTKFQSNLQYLTHWICVALPSITVSTRYLPHRHRGLIGWMPTTACGRAPHESTPYLESHTRRTLKISQRMTTFQSTWCFVSNLNIGIQLPNALIWQAYFLYYVLQAIPYFYITFLTVLLMDRANRDDRNCRIKYHKYYEAYSKRVRFKIIPRIFWWVWDWFSGAPPSG